MDNMISGCCWNCGDDVTVYQIIKEEHWTMQEMDAAAMGNWVFEDLEPRAEGMQGGFKLLGFDIVIAGKNFGCGNKSVEHPMAALIGAGVRLVIAESFSRYNYRNAINLTLPVLTCPGIRQFAHMGDRISANLLSGEIINMTSNQTIQGDGLSEFALKIIASGGLLEHIMARAKR
ncbi:MAG: hypothetical protein LBV12_04880 [Puniceicoccales bacterium]|jgi:3-isopropylmalate/(R)-2-methylmalate dehydratase small subunit|nr:hypothetical protein [Puniceicoccales bacterium]